jgi:hypothetical protein
MLPVFPMLVMHQLANKVRRIVGGVIVCSFDCVTLFCVVAMFCTVAMFSSSIVDFLYPNCECSCLGCVMSYPKAQFASLNHHASQALDELSKATEPMQHVGAASTDQQQ